MLTLLIKSGFLELRTMDAKINLAHNNLENLRRMDLTWKGSMIEEEFKRLTFEVEDM